MQKITFFQAANLSDTEVIDQFVARKKELDQILGEIRQDDMAGSIQHYILVGQRGSGKSTLLRRIQAAVNTEPALKDRLIAVNLSEEQAGIYRLHDLWERVCDELRVKGLDVNDVDWASYDGDLTAYARALYEAMQHALKKADKKLVLLLDNIDRILENIKTADNHLFREQLMNHKDVRIVGGSTRLSEHHWKYDQPFYQFFQIIRLLPLTEEEMEELLMYWADFMEEPKLKNFILQGKGKLNAVRILSDGTPRTMLHLVDLLINRPEEHGYEYLRYIIDRATPIYQERLGTLSTQHQKVVLELSFFWDATQVKDLVNATKLDSKTVSSALNKLVELQIVEKRKGTGKNMHYLLKERFFNLWLIMTQGGPKQKSRVKWLTVFLETWYSPDELRSIYADFNQDLCSGKLKADQAVVMTKALVHSSSLSIAERDTLLENAHKLIGDNREYLDMLPPRAKDMLKEVFQHVGDEKWEKALRLLNEIEQDDATMNAAKGYLHAKLGNIGEAEKEYLRAIEKGHVQSMFTLAILYQDTGESKKAEQYYLQAIEKKHRGALNNLAKLYHGSDRLEQAEKYYLQAIEKGQVHALNNLAILYRETHRTEEAEQYYLRAIEKGEVDAFYNLANLYKAIGRTEEAEEYYLQAIEKGVDNAFVNLGLIYMGKVAFKEAREYFEKFLLERGQDGSLHNRLFRLTLGVWTGYPEVLQHSDLLVAEAWKDNDIKVLVMFFRDILIHFQENTVWGYFQNPIFGDELKERLAPFYFASAKLLGNTEVMLTMPPELEEPVARIMEKVKEGREHFYGSQPKGR